MELKKDIKYSGTFDNQHMGNAFSAYSEHISRYE
jgi:hypothetical protein